MRDLLVAGAVALIALLYLFGALGALAASLLAAIIVLAWFAVVTREQKCRDAERNRRMADLRRRQARNANPPQAGQTDTTAKDMP